MGEWGARAHEAARDAIEYLIDDIIPRLIETEGSAPTDIFEYSEDYHHSSHVDKSYRLKDAAALLEDLSDYEETDSGLWEGQEPRDAISTMAAFTYGNTVASDFSDYMEMLNNIVEDSKIEAGHPDEKYLDTYVRALVAFVLRGGAHPGDFKGGPKGGPARRWELEEEE